MSSLTHDIDPTLSVNDILRRYPSSLRLLSKRGIDTCCDGGLPLSVAAADANLDLSDLLDELKAVVFGAEETTP